MSGSLCNLNLLHVSPS
uniref:Uncharacterized protein n=1 Tax=Anguilla anguilla TaxID=7936 RepID=A0A0E9XTB5_ANGAN